MSSAMTSMDAQRRTITAFFDRRSDADAAVERLIKLGIARGSVHVVAGQGSPAASVTGQSSNELGFWDSLKDMFLPDEDRATYAEGLRRGGYLVTVQTEDAYYERALDILDDEGTVDLDQRSQTWRNEGWTDHSATGASSAAVAAVRTPAPAVGQTARNLTEGEETIALTEEQLRVGKREVSHGRVRVRSYVVETPVQEQIGLREERVTIQRRPVDRAVTGTENLFQDRTIEAEERVEEAVVSKEARVKEELVIGKTAEQRTETVRDTVRRTEVEIEDERGVKTGTATSPTSPDRKVS